MTLRESLPGEVWKPIPGYEGQYEVSNMGRVWSVPRGWINRIGRRTTVPGKILGQTADRRGYMRAGLDKFAHGNYVHRLVMLAFVGPLPKGMVTCHNDGDRTNNCLSNLRYDTASENVRDSVRHGTQHAVRKTHCPQDHPYDEENTRWVRRKDTASGKSRVCRICSRERVRQRRAAARGEAA